MAPEAEMRALDVTAYQVKLMTPEGWKDVLVNMRALCREIMLAPQLNLMMMEALDNDVLAQRIASEPTETVLLAEDDYQKLLGYAQRVKGITERELEGLRRIRDARKITVAPVEGQAK